MKKNVCVITGGGSGMGLAAAKCMPKDKIIVVTGRTMSKLEKAVNNLSIDIDRPFHSAVNDAFYTAQVLAKIHPRDLADRYSYDVYNNPKAKEDEIISYHKHYMEHISREFDDKKDIINIPTKYKLYLFISALFLKSKTFIIIYKLIYLCCCCTMKKIIFKGLS